MRKLIQVLALSLIALGCVSSARAQDINVLCSSAICPIITNKSFDSFAGGGTVFTFNMTPGSSVAFYQIAVSDPSASITYNLWITGNQNVPDFSHNNLSWVPATMSVWNSGGLVGKNLTSITVTGTPGTWLIALDSFTTSRIALIASAGTGPQIVNLVADIANTLVPQWFASSGGGGGSGCDTTGVTAGEILLSNGDGTCSGIAGSVGNTVDGGFTLADGSGNTNIVGQHGFVTTNSSGDFVGCMSIAGFMPSVTANAGCNGNTAETGATWIAQPSSVGPTGFGFQTANGLGEQTTIAGATITQNGMGSLSIVSDATAPNITVSDGTNFESIVSNNAINANSIGSSAQASLNPLGKLSAFDSTGSTEFLADTTGPLVSLVNANDSFQYEITPGTGPTVFQGQDSTGAIILGQTQGSHGGFMGVSDGGSNSAFMTASTAAPGGGQLEGTAAGNILLKATIVADLPAATGTTGVFFYVNDSTAIAVEGQTCVGGGTVKALATWNGTIWKCF